MAATPLADPRDPLAALIEAFAALQRDRALRAWELRLTNALRRAFLLQRDAFLDRFQRFHADYPPLREATAPPWQPAFDEAALATLQAFALPLDQAAQQAVAAGALQAMSALDYEGTFTLAHPKAVEFLQQFGAARVTRINDTTRAYLRTILTRAADEGWSYDRTAAAITARYAEFAGPPLRYRPRHIASRAHAIAVFELGDAYEAGAEFIARDLIASGLRLQKSWLTVGDHRVRPEHHANQNAGWIAYDDPFPSGHLRPPTDPGCRCTLLVRRAPSPPPTAPPKRQRAKPAKPKFRKNQPRLTKADRDAMDRLVSDVARGSTQGRDAVADAMLKDPDIRVTTARALGIDEATVRGWSDKELWRAVRDRVDLIAQTWNDISWGDPLVDSLHLAVKDEFGITGAWFKYPEADLRQTIDPYLYQFARTYVRAQYAVTQQWLADRGWDFVPVARGLRDSSRKLTHDLPRGGQAVKPVELGPLNSATVQRRTAEQFAGPHGAILEAKVPRESIFALHATGIGTDYEAELLVMATARDWTVRRR